MEISDQTTIVFCTYCNKYTDHKHVHSIVHGMKDTHISGSERFECIECEFSTYYGGQEHDKFKFKLDGPTKEIS